jgi:hypothetical protein
MSVLIGKNTRFQVASGNTYADLCLTTSLSLDRSTDSFDGTAFQNTNRVTVPTLSNFAGSLGAIFSNDANTATSLDTVVTAVEAGMSTAVAAKVIMNYSANSAVYSGGLFLSGSLSAELNGPVAGTISFTAANNITFTA